MNAGVWRLKDHSCITMLKGHTKELIRIALLNNGQLITSSRDNYLRIWSTTDYTCLTKFLVTTPVVWFHIYKKKIYSSSTDETVRVWKNHPKGVKLISQTQFADLNCLPIGSKKNILLLKDNHLDLYSPQGKSWARFVSPTKVTCATPYEHYVYCGYVDGSVRLWSVKNGESISTFNIHKAEVTGILCYGDMVITYSQDGSIQMFPNEIS